MTLLSFISAFCTSLSIVIGSFTLRENIRSSLNWLFAALCFTVGYVSFTEFGYRQSESPNTALFWLKLSFLSPLLIPLMLHYIIQFTALGSKKLISVMILLNYVIALIFVLIDFYTGQISGIPNYSIYGWDHNTVNGRWYQLYTFWALIMYSLLVYMITNYYFRVKYSAEKIRAKYTMYAFTIISIFAITTEKIFPVIEFEFPELSTLGFVIANVLIGYAMWKYKILSISPVRAAKNIVETMSDSLLLIDTENNVVSSNSAADNMFESSSAKLIKINACMLFFDNDSYVQFLKLTDNWKKPVTDFSSQFRTLNGNLIPVSISTSVLTDSSGFIAGYVLIARNISERIAAQHALQNANQLLEKRVSERTAELIESNVNLVTERDRLDITLRSIGDGVIVLTTDSEIELLNPKAEEIIGCSYVAVKGCNVKDIYTITPSESSQVLLDPVGDTLKTGKWLEHDAYLKTMENACRRVEGSTAPIRDESDKIIGCVLVFRDCTEKYALQQELIKINRLEWIGTLAGHIAYDFEFILKNITNNMLLIKLLAIHNTDTVKLINDTEKMAFDAQMLTKRLSTLSDSNDHQQSEQIESVKDMINNSIGFIISSESIDYDVIFDEDLMNIQMDKSNFQTILSNLVNNAQEAVRNDGFISIEARNVFVKDSNAETCNIPKGHQINPGWYVKVTIRDNGPGISETAQEKAFDPFFTTKIGKRGLGLPVAYSIIKRKSGTMFFEPQIQEGCAVSFIIPSTDMSTPEQLRFSKNDLILEENSVISGRLLLIEKDTSIRKQISQALTEAGFYISDTDDLLNGIKNFNESLFSIPFDSIICGIDCITNDIFYQFLSRIKISNQQLKIIGIKKHYDSNYDSRLLNTYFSEILMAPIHMKQLIQTIRKVFSL